MLTLVKFDSFALCCFVLLVLLVVLEKVMTSIVRVKMVTWRKNNSFWLPDAVAVCCVRAIDLFMVDIFVRLLCAHSLI